MRPRLCSICREPATWVILDRHNAVHVSLDARVDRFTQERGTYFCDRHVPA